MLRLETTRGDGEIIIRTTESCEPGRWFTGYWARINAWERVIRHPSVWPMFQPSFSEAEARQRHRDAVDAVDRAVLVAIDGGGEG